MQVTCIAKTEIPLRSVNYLIEDALESEFSFERYADEEDTERLIEFAGRACYQSFNRPNEATADPKDYIANILAKGHFSVLEHASASFYVTGVSRNLLLELERHRHLSFSVLSQRFVNSENATLIIPPALRNIDEDMLPKLWAEAYAAAQDAYAHTVASLGDLARKERREAARAILPGGVETKFVVTGNMRAWRDVLQKRFSVHADAEICELAGMILDELLVICPAAFSDFPEEPFDD